MKKEDVNQILARNLIAAAKNEFLRNNGEVNQSALARSSGIPQTTISLILNPGRRAPLNSGKDPTPTLSKIISLADSMGLEAWQLLHPNPDLARRQQELYERMQSEFGSGNQGQTTVTPEAEKRVTHLKQAAPGLREQLIAMFDSATTEQQKSIIAIVRNFLRHIPRPGKTQSWESD